MNDEQTWQMEYIDLDQPFELEGWLDQQARDAGPDARVLRTPVWLLMGLTRSVPAALQVAGDRIMLATSSCPLFDVRLQQIRDVRYPWWWFGGGVKLMVGRRPYRISFVRPNDGSDAVTRLVASRLAAAGGPAALQHAASKLRDVRHGRAMGRAWRALLGRT